MPVETGHFLLSFMLLRIFQPRGMCEEGGAEPQQHRNDSPHLGHARLHLQDTDLLTESSHTAPEPQLHMHFRCAHCHRNNILKGRVDLNNIIFTEPLLAPGTSG